MRLNRRVFSLLSISSLATLSLAQNVFADGPEITAGTPEPVATPAKERFRGDLNDLWRAPWELEGKELVFKGVIQGVLTAPEEQRISLKVAGRVYHFESLIDFEIPETINENVFVATNEDLKSIEGKFTAEVIGFYNGEVDVDMVEGRNYGGRPLIVATKIGLAQ